MLFLEARLDLNFRFYIQHVKHIQKYNPAIREFLYGAGNRDRFGFALNPTRNVIGPEKLHHFAQPITFKTKTNCNLVIVCLPAL